MQSYLLKYKKELIIIAVSLLGSFLGYAFDFYYIIFNGDFSMRFSDADDYMMMTRLRDFFVHGDMAYSLIHRVNVPFGVDIYWSHLYDFFLIVPIGFVNLFLHSIDKSIEYVCFFSAPVIKGVLCLITYSFFKKIVVKPQAFLGALLLAITPDLDEITQFGRPDHHIFILMFEIIYLYTLVNIIKNNFSKKADYVKSGIVAALCIWAAVETLSLVLLAEIVLFFSSYNDVRKVKFLYAKAIATACGIGIIVLLSFPLKLDHVVGLVALTLTAMITIRQLSHWHFMSLVILLAFFRDSSAVYDKISSMHLVLYLCASLYFAVNAFYLEYSSKISIKFSVATGLVLGAAFLYRYPRFLLGVEGGASDFLRQVWFPHVQDLTSPLEFSYNDSICFCFFAVTLFVAIYDQICRLTRKKYENIDVFWWVLIVLNVVYCVFASLVRRMIPSTAVLSLPLFLNFAMNGLIFKSYSEKIKVVLACALILFPAVSIKYVHMLKELIFHSADFLGYFKYKQQEIYEEDGVFRFLNNELGPDPVVIMADPYSGPRLLYHTKHNVVAVPFHSQEKGVISSLTITIKSRTEEKETKEILKSTNSSYVFINKRMCACPGSSTNLANFMMHGHIPKWIKPMQLPISEGKFILAKICKDQL
ncbi:MAG: hypothetical protein LBQ08_02015 [Holosporaceae bacterium]|nr:hypothetical protein [Holosporaceae bacterium]